MCRGVESINWNYRSLGVFIPAGRLPCREKKMKCLAFALVALVGLIAATPDANAVVCAHGVYRAGCAGPHGAVVVRHPYHPYAYRPYHPYHPYARVYR